MMLIDAMLVPQSHAPDARHHEFNFRERLWQQHDVSRRRWTSSGNGTTEVIFVCDDAIPAAALCRSIPLFRFSQQYESVDAQRRSKSPQLSLV